MIKKYVWLVRLNFSFIYLRNRRNKNVMAEIQNGHLEDVEEQILQDDELNVTEEIDHAKLVPIWYFSVPSYYLCSLNIGCRDLVLLVVHLLLILAIRSIFQLDQF